MGGYLRFVCRLQSLRRFSGGGLGEKRMTIKL